MADLDRQVAVLVAEESTERSKLLSQKQDEHVNALLRAVYVANANIHGVADELTTRMVQRGFQTAADITRAVFRVRGIGNKKGRAVLAWRDAARARAESTKPTRLTAAEDQAIRERFAARRVALLAQRDKVTAGLPAEEQAFGCVYTQTITRLDNEEAAKLREVETKKQQAQTRAQAVIEDATRELQELGRERQSPPVVQARQRWADARQQQNSVNWRKARLDHQVNVGRARLTRLRYAKWVLGIA